MEMLILGNGIKNMKRHSKVQILISVNGKKKKIEGWGGGGIFGNFFNMVWVSQIAKIDTHLFTMHVMRLSIRLLRNSTPFFKNNREVLHSQRRHFSLCNMSFDCVPNIFDRI